MKKFIAMIAALTLCLSLAACADTQDSSSASGGTAESSSADASSSEAAPDSSSSDTETTSSEGDENVAEGKITLSGDPKDTFEAETDCYAENDRIVIYFQKGVTVRGDMLTVAEKVLDDLSETTGFDFDKHIEPTVDRGFALENNFAEGVFADVDPDEKKIGIFVAELGERAPWADGSSATVESWHFDYDEDAYGTLFHELSHVLQFRNGISLGGLLNEGFAAYMENRALLEHGIPTWTAAQYYYPAEFDESLISETEFTYSFEDYELNYQYGFRLLTYLYETYGNDIYSKLLSAAAEAGFNASYNIDDYEASIKANSEALLAVIRSVTADTVLSDFKAWYEENWEARAQEYMDKLNAM